jgi:hypothetical protein
MFLLWKATTEIHASLEGEEEIGSAKGTASFGGTLVQIVLLDIVFSLDSVLTAVGVVDELPIMVAAVVIAVGVMLFASGPLSKFVHKHPSVKVLGLSFLLLIGVNADGPGPRAQGLRRGDGLSSWRLNLRPGAAQGRGRRAPPHLSGDGRRPTRL